jgi:hypothetical protein
MPSREPGAAELQWRKARRSTGHGACVEVAATADFVAVRDSKNPYGDILTPPPVQWRKFLAAAKNGAFDLR